MLRALTVQQVRDVVELAGSYRGRHATAAIHLDNSKRRALCQAIRKLPPTARRELTALMWVGRGIYQVSEWSAACCYAGANQEEADLAYMVENGPLGEHLACGLEKLASRVGVKPHPELEPGIASPPDLPRD
jgi:hypothetical protein